MTDISATQEAKPKIFDFNNISGDIFGGITVGIVALPLAIAFGVSSGAGPVAGLWGAIIVGFCAALFGGTATQITGPTGPMIVVFGTVWAALNQDPSLVFAAVVLGGIFQILMGVFKLGKYIRLVPYPVISGFMSGIGVIIILLQIPPLLGGPTQEDGPVAAAMAIPSALANTNMAALAIGLMALLMIFFWPKRVGKFLPGPLAALIAGTLLCLFIPNVPLLEFETGWPHFVMPSINSATFLIVFVAAVQLSLLGAVDSLLTSLIADNATRTRHNSNQELIGQGIGNSIAGLFGAIPGAGATMRTMVNIKSGGTTKISGMVHALLLLAVVVALAPLAKNIPNTVLAGILIKVGWDIIDWAYIRSLMKGPRFDYFLMVVVLVLTVFTDLITAVGSGVFLACAAYVWNMAEDQLEDIERTGNSTTTDEEMQLIDQTGGSVSLFDFGGPLSFAAAADLGHHVRRRSAKDTEAIVLDFSRITFVDVSSAQAVDTIASDAKDAGKLVFTSGMNDQVREKLVGLGSDVHLEPANDFSRRIDALKAAAKAVLTGSKDSDTQSDTGMNSAVPAE